MSDDFDFDKALDRLLDAPESRRAGLLSQIQQDNPDVIQRLERLLAFAVGDTRSPTSADDTAPVLFEQMLVAQDLDRVGSEVGPYVITSLINRGGMGVVFRAERNDGAYEQTVAIKFLPRLAKSSQRRALFLNERATLARLEHPNIARIIDAGLTQDDIPYFVMEYVSGKNIQDYCITISVKRRLETFKSVCDAVSYCHQSFIVHGDIKPSNILVADGRVRLLDFGVGKWTKDQNAEVSKAAIGFSEAFAAPELKRGDAHSIATDIFALGVLLQNILSSPSDAKLDQDLQLIIDQCLKDNPSNRFQSVEALKREVDAYLGDFPITVRKADRPYAFRKFIKRNQIALAGVSGIFLSLVAGISLTYWQYSEAKMEAQRATETSAFVKSLFDRVNPEDAGAEDVTLRQVMDEAAFRIENELQSSPEVRHEIMALIASGYYGLGDYEKSLSLRETVLKFHQNTKRSPNLALARALGDIADDYATAGDYDQARETMREAIVQFEALGLDDTLEFADLLGRYTLKMTGGVGNTDDVQTAIKALERKGAILEKRAPDDRYLKYIHLSHLASTYDELGDYERAAQLKEEAVALADKIGFSLRMSAITTLCNLGYSYDGLGRYEDAIATHKECIKRWAERLGKDHPEIIPPKQNLAAAHIDLGQFRQGKAILLEVVENAETQLPANSFTRLAAEINLARVHVLTNDIEAALSALPDILSRMEEALGSNSASAGRVKSILGKAYLENGEVDLALFHLQEAYKIIEASDYWRQPGSHWASDVTVWRAQAELAAGNISIALKLANAGLEIRRAEKNVQSWRIEEATKTLDGVVAIHD